MAWRLFCCGTGWCSGCWWGPTASPPTATSPTRWGPTDWPCRPSHHGVPFHPVAPYSTVDPLCPDGAAIPIEMRNGAEVRGFREVRWAPRTSAVFNPSFDVTPATLVTSLVLDRGILSREQLQAKPLRACSECGAVRLARPERPPPRGPLVLDGAFVAHQAPAAAVEGIGGMGRPVLQMDPVASRSGSGPRAPAPLRAPAGSRCPCGHGRWQAEARRHVDEGERGTALASANEESPRSPRRTLPPLPVSEGRQLGEHLLGEVGLGRRRRPRASWRHGSGPAGAKGDRPRRTAGPGREPARGSRASAGASWVPGAGPGHSPGPPGRWAGTPAGPGARTAAGARAGAPGPGACRGSPDRAGGAAPCGPARSRESFAHGIRSTGKPLPGT